MFSIANLLTASIILFVATQFCIAFIFSRNSVPLYPVERIVRSSANRYGSLNLRTSGRSLMGIQNRRGQRRDLGGRHL